MHDFWKNHAQNVRKKLVPDRFLKNKIEHSYGSIVSSFIKFVILWQVEGYRNILKLSCGPLAFNSYQTFLKNKKRSGTSLLASFSAYFLRKLFLLLYSFIWQNFIVWLPLLCEIWAICVLQLFVNHVATSWIMKLTLFF